MSLPLNPPGVPVVIGPKDSLTESDPAKAYDELKAAHLKTIAERDQAHSQLAEVRKLMEDLKAQLLTLVDDVAEELIKEYVRGWNEAGRAIAYEVRAEMVCCDIYEQGHDAYKAGGFKHDLCYWAGASAHLAEEMSTKDPFGVEEYKKNGEGFNPEIVVEKPTTGRKRKRKTEDK